MFEVLNVYVIRSCWVVCFTQFYCIFYLDCCDAVVLVVCQAFCFLVNFPVDFFLCVFCYVCELMVKTFWYVFCSDFFQSFWIWSCDLLAVMVSYLIGCLVFSRILLSLFCGSSFRLVFLFIGYFCGFELVCWFLCSFLLD